MLPASSEQSRQSHAVFARRSLSTLCAALTAAFAVACGGSPTESATSATATARAVVIWAIDIANNGDASDVEVRFRAPEDLTDIAEFRVFLLDAAAAPTFDAQASNGAPASSWVSAPAGSGEIDVSFLSSATTTDGRVLYFNDVGRTTGSDRLIGPIVIRMLLFDAEPTP